MDWSLFNLLRSVGYVGSGWSQFLTPDPREMCEIVIQDLCCPLLAS